MIEKSSRKRMYLLHFSFLSFSDSFFDNLRLKRIVFSWWIINWSWTINKWSWTINKRCWLLINNSTFKWSSEVWENTSEHFGTLLLFSLSKRGLNSFLIVTLGWTSRNKRSLWLFDLFLWSNYWSWSWLCLFCHLDSFLNDIWHFASLLLLGKCNMLLNNLISLSFVLFWLFLLLNFLLKELLSISSFFLLCCSNSACNYWTFLNFLLMSLIVHLFLDLIHGIHDLCSVLFFFFLLFNGINLCVKFVLSFNIFRCGIDNSLRRLVLLRIHLNCQVERRLLTFRKSLLRLQCINNLFDLRFRLSIDGHILNLLFSSSNYWFAWIMTLINLCFSLSTLFFLWLECWV